MVPSRAHSPQVDPLCRACTACYARLEDRPLGVWVGEGLKEEIAGERGPRRPSQRRYDEKLWESSIDSPIDGTMVSTLREYRVIANLRTIVLGLRRDFAQIEPKSDLSLT